MKFKSKPIFYLCIYVTKICFFLIALKLFRCCLNRGIFIILIFPNNIIILSWQLINKTDYLNNIFYIEFYENYANHHGQMANHKRCFLSKFYKLKVLTVICKNNLFRFLVKFAYIVFSVYVQQIQQHL